MNKYDGVKPGALMKLRNTAATMMTMFGLLACQMDEGQVAPLMPASAPAEAKKDGAILRYDAIHHPVIGRYGMVVSQNDLATEVGQQILEQGGNAVDAAVAVGFALAATLPRAGNLGGSGFMVVHLAESNETIALDFRSAAPALAKRENYLNGDGTVDWQAMTFGPKAPAVPGTVAGLYEAWQRFGSLPWPVLLAPAHKLAADGFIISDDLAFALREAMPVMSRYPSSVAAYMKDANTSYKAGERLKQRDLAWSINQISQHGADAFYRGAIAQKISQFMTEAGGYISQQDLSRYRVHERQPISTTYRNHKVVTMPPSSGGGLALLQMLNILQHFPLASMPAGSADSLHIIAEAMKRVAANRRVGVGDPDFVDVPVEGILSPQLARDMAGDIDHNRAKSVAKITPVDANPYESRETTHYSVMDKDGNAVSTTYTLGYSFGSGVVVPGTGIILDNQVKNFSHRDPKHANAIAPGKRMLSTMTPTLVFNPQDEVFLVTGSPGGSRIINIVAQIIINTIDYKMNIAEATHRPRIHQQWRTPALGVEHTVNKDSLEILKSRGHQIDQQATMGSSQSIMYKNGFYYGAADPRRPGAQALGVDHLDN